MADQLTVHSTVEGSTVTVVLSGHLTGATAIELLDAVRRALDGDATRVDIDLCQLTSFADGGPASLATCHDWCARLSDGLHFRTEGGAGQAAVLAAFDAAETPAV